MRPPSVLSLLLALAGGCAPKPAPPPAAPPPPAIECATGRVAKGDHCVPIDNDCRTGERLEVGVGCVPESTTPATPPPPDPKREAGTFSPAPGVDVRDLTVGTGPLARAGATLSVHYRGTFLDGRPFDSSIERNAPFRFKLGGGMVIKGWEEGIVGMRVGGRRVLTLEPAMAYGERGRPPQIPPRATLVFEIELLEVR